MEKRKKKDSPLDYTQRGREGHTLMRPLVGHPTTSVGNAVGVQWSPTSSFAVVVAQMALSNKHKHKHKHKHKNQPTHKQSKNETKGTRDDKKPQTTTTTTTKANTTDLPPTHTNTIESRNSPPLCVRCGEGTLGGEGDNPTPLAVAANRAAAGPAFVLPDADAEEEEEEEEAEEAVGASEEEWVASVVGKIDNDGDGVGAWRVEPVGAFVDVRAGVKSFASIRVHGHEGMRTWS
jgi:hypothetical protein